MRYFFLAVSSFLICYSSAKGETTNSISDQKLQSENVTRVTCESLQGEFEALKTQINLLSEQRDAQIAIAELKANLKSKDLERREQESDLIKQIRYQDEKICQIEQRLSGMHNKISCPPPHQNMGDQIADVQCRLDRLECEPMMPICSPSPEVCYLQGATDTGCCGWFADVAFLYWTVKEGGLGYAVGPGPATSSVPSTAIGTVQSVDFDWSPGVRVSLGYLFCDCWHLVGQYTYFNTDGSDSSSAPSIGSFHGLFPQLVGEPDMLTSAKSKACFTYHTFDLLTSRTFLLACSLKNTLFGGITGAFINQDWKTLYVGPEPTDFQTFKSHWEFSGAGLKFGDRLDWKWRCFGFFGEISAAILCGSYENRFKSVSFGTVAGVVTDVKIDDPRIVPTIDCMIAPYYETCICGKNLKIYAAYEIQSWFNLQELLLTRGASSTENIETGGRDNRTLRGLIGLHGVTIGIRTGF